MTRRFTKIKGLSENRRLPRLGKIRLGVKKVAANGKEYPSETDYFVVPEEVQKVYGAQPKELDIMLPVDDPAVVFPQAYEFYGSGRGLKCTGDGEVAMRMNEETKALEEVECPCPLLEAGKCKQRAHLAVLLPKVSVGGIYAIDTSSFNSIIDLNSGLDYVRALIGRIAMVPLKIKREARETHHDGKKQTHYTLRIELEGNIEFLNQLRENTTRVLSGPTYSLPAPVLENPEFDEGATIVPEADPEQPAPAEAKPPIYMPPAEETAGQEQVSIAGLLAEIESATAVTEVNAVLAKTDGLSAEDKRAVNKAAAQAIKRITQPKAAGSGDYRKASGR